MKFKLESLNLPKVSAAGMRILDVLAKDDYSMSDVAVVVAEDPTLSGMMLKYANSPL
ncbi:MAG: HDOD domain-containing protein [Gammaproteobacteria bacterium]|nr:HDOD domain-containing protein [Gammaproteobacteria bacterium]